MQKKKHSILSSIIYYRLGWYALSLVLILKYKDDVLNLFCYYTGIQGRGYMYRLLIVIIYGGIIWIWARVFFIKTRNRRYYRLTGRSYPADNGMYHLEYSELVNYYIDAEPQKMDTDKLPRKHWQQSGGLIMGRYKNRLISFEPKENGIVLFVWGRPGIGKTTSVIIPSAQRFGMVLENGEYVQKGAVMVYDMKGDIYDANKDIRKIKRFSLVHPEESCHFDMLERARGMSDTQRAHFLDDLATTLIPDTGNEDSAYFDKVGRAFCTAIFLQCLNEDSSKGFTDICLEILLNSYEYWIHKIKEADYTIALKYCARFEAENPRNVGGGYSKLCEALGLFTSEPLDQMLNPSDNMISPDNLENGIDVYIQVPLGEANLNAPIVAVIFEVFMRAAFQREIGQNPPIAYIIDEFGQIPKMPIIAASAALMRAYNASLLISCQALSQIFATYGEQGSKTLIDCSRGHCIMSINDPDTRDWASRMIGTRKVLRIGGSVGVKEAASRSANEDREPVFQPEAFGLLPLDRSLIIYMDGQYVMGKPTYYLS